MERERNIPHFYYVQGDEGTSLVNLDQVKVVDEIRDGHCRLVFENSFTISLNGRAVSELIGFLIANSKLLDGTSFAEKWEEGEKARTAKSE